ncbi:unnamed protein product [Thelazia callipaeda]|uniref:Protein dpy-30 homolog n=1 Tax=Thelazia callipaeda TaxID=103827 RepID=A0A0N5CXP3_THECL|nr:unnamed protein product [Thelazia callipaeda]
MSAMDTTEQPAVNLEQPKEQSEEMQQHMIEETKKEDVLNQEESMKPIESSGSNPPITLENTESTTEAEKKDGNSAAGDGGNNDGSSSASTTIPTRQYLDQTVVPILLQALGALAKERPPNPIDFLANYLIKEKARFSSSAREQQQNESTH